eukprot:173952_1
MRFKFNFRAQWNQNNIFRYQRNPNKPSYKINLYTLQKEPISANDLIYLNEIDRNYYKNFVKEQFETNQINFQNIFGYNIPNQCIRPQSQSQPNQPKRQLTNVQPISQPNPINYQSNNNRIISQPICLEKKQQQIQQT